MFSRSIGIGLLAAACLTAGAGGAYVATRYSAAAPAEVDPPPTPVTVPASSGAQPVAETEAVVQPGGKAEPRPQPEAPTPEIEPAAPRTGRAPAGNSRAVPAMTRSAAAAQRSAQKRDPESRVADPVLPPVEPVTSIAPSLPPVESAPRPEPALPSTPAEPQFEEVILPSATVIGVEVETSVSSERAKVEDRVDGRVTRDVYVDGRLVIPSRSRMIGAVTLVERGGKMKERARLGVRFHTLVLDEGRQIALRTETIVREGEPPSGESSRKIGGATIGGAVLGAIIGGGKGAALGGAAGAAGGTAAVMAGGRNAATLASGTIVTARLSEPVAIDVEKR